ncbi:hypothetical protein NKH71_31545 [Mesorhizobium sp. M0983]
MSTKNNHPENLIWLCGKHHTKFDKHSYGPNPRRPSSSPASCQGDRKMEQRYAEQTDLRVECLVCEGERDWHDRPCPGCGGEGKLDQRQVDRIGMRDYEMIETGVRWSE